MTSGVAAKEISPQGSIDAQTAQRYFELIVYDITTGNRGFFVFLSVPYNRLGWHA